VRLGSPAQELIELANLLDADLVVVGTHGRTGLGRLLVGSVAEAAVKKARCPVLVVREKNHPTVSAPA
jgi:nucleotide-binding universal stress UspA family protein